MADTKTAAPRQRRSTLANLDLDTGTGKPKPAMPAEEIRKISEAGGFPSRTAFQKVKSDAPSVASPTVSKAKSTVLSSGDRFSSAVDQADIDAALKRRKGEGAPQAKVQFNTRISELHYARLANVKDHTRLPYSTLIEMAIDLLSVKIEEDSK